MQNQQTYIPNKFWELYGKKAFTADTQAENLAVLKAENDRLRARVAELARKGDAEDENR